MFEIRKVWNNWDKFSVILHFISIALMIGFFLFVVWFSFFGIKPIIIKRKAERRKKHKATSSKVTSEMKRVQMKNNDRKTYERTDTFKRKSESFFNSFILAIDEKYVHDLEKSENVKESDFEVYEPLISGLLLHKRSSSFLSLRFLLRRTVIVASIVFLS